MWLEEGVGDRVGDVGGDLRVGVVGRDAEQSRAADLLDEHELAQALDGVDAARPWRGARPRADAVDAEEHGVLREAEGAEGSLGDDAAADDLALRLVVLLVGEDAALVVVADALHLVEHLRAGEVEDDRSRWRATWASASRSPRRRRRWRARR
jgi:hypothetical protein